MNTGKCCKATCSNYFTKFEPQQFPPYYDSDPNSRIKRKVQPKPTQYPPTCDTDKPKACEPKIVLIYEKYDLRQLPY